MYNFSLSLGLLEELARFGALTANHGTRRLLDHLCGTFVILQEWKNPSAVCLAGLFHSIYGTLNYQHGLIAPDTIGRSRIRRIIGEEAEAIVYLYGSIPLDHLVFQRRANGGGLTSLSQLIFHKDLLEIHAANLIEQARDAEHTTVSQWTEALSIVESSRELLSVGARQALSHPAFLKTRPNLFLNPAEV